MNTLRLTIKSIPLVPVPPGYPMFGLPQRQKWVYRIRRSGSVIGSGVTSDVRHPDRILATITA